MGLGKMSDNEAFEAWYCKKFSVALLSRKILMHRNAQGRYSNNSVQVRWEAWQAACEVKAA